MLFPAVPPDNLTCYNNTIDVFIICAVKPHHFRAGRMSIEVI